MAFNREQTRRMQAGVVISLLVVAVVLLIVVLSGGVGAKVGGTASAGSSSASSAASSAPTAAAASGDSDLSSMDDVNATYGAAEQKLKAQFEADPSNPSALLNLANGYFDWGYAAMGYATSDDDTAHVTDLFTQAVTYYDQYLQGSPSSKSVQVDRAIAIFYAGDTTRAIDTLEAFTAGTDDFGPAWANLGMFYEAAGRTDDAKAAYERAVKADPDDTYQVKTYAQQRLDALSQDK